VEFLRQVTFETSCCQIEMSFSVDKSIMDTNTTKLNNFVFSSIPDSTKKALDFLSTQKWIGGSGWYLAGGTALALQAGNRKSVDLDFFTTEKDFETEDVLSHFKDNKNWDIGFERPNTVYGVLCDAKVSFIAYPFFVPKQKFLEYGFVKILDKTDVAVMKIVAISQRGRKRDFFDLYWCAQNIEPLQNIIRRLPEQYPSVAHDYHHILKSMVYFDDAESDPEPVIFFDADWKKVKSFFQKEIPELTKKLMQLNYK